jgi:hypothetical protein
VAVGTVGANIGISRAAGSVKVCTVQVPIVVRVVIRRIIFVVVKYMMLKI